MCNNPPKALIAMSGGVDSSVAALLTVQRGMECIGVMMKLFTNDDIGESRANACCSAADADDAQAVAHKLGIPFYVLNFKDDFRQQVIGRFVQAYEKGETPNPCIDCNRFLKFDRLLRRATELGIDTIVSGHYARVAYDAGSGRYLLKKGVDASKDQSYVLYAMTQEQLSRTLFPVGELRKEQVRALAAQYGFVNADKQDSQDICFVPNGDYAAFIERHTGRACPKGRFIDAHGNDLGEHKGMIHYTVGQRKGLGLTAETPLYVRELRAEDNTVVVGTDRELYGKTLTACGINLIAIDGEIHAPLRVDAKIRYAHKAQPATVWQTGADQLTVVFDTPQRAITRGQALVLYDGEVVVGGGTIE